MNNLKQPIRQSPHTKKKGQKSPVLKTKDHEKKLSQNVFIINLSTNSMICA